MRSGSDVLDPDPDYFQRSGRSQVPKGPYGAPLHVWGRETRTAQPVGTKEMKRAGSHAGPLFALRQLVPLTRTLFPYTTLF